MLPPRCCIALVGPTTAGDDFDLLPPFSGEVTHEGMIGKVVF